MSAPPNGLPRVLRGLGAEPLSYPEHVSLHGQLPLGGRGLIAELDRAGLVGHGGGAFRTAAKFGAVLSARGRPIVLVNGCEGEPTSEKDHLLLRRLPHLVLDGATLAARAIGADEIAVAIEREERATVRAVSHAIGERLEPLERDGIGLYVIGVPGGYVSGQETTVINAINGGPAKPNVTPPYPSERGIAGRPTLVNNAETLAHVALVARHGAAWHRSIGTPGQPGSRLVTIGGAVGRPGVIETANGTTLGTVVRAAGGLAEPVQAFLLGGYAGTWAGPDSLAVPLEEAELRRRGGTLGAGLVYALPDSSCPVAEVARVARWLAANSAGQCGPCTFGLNAIAGALEGLCEPGREDPAQAFQHVRRWCRQTAGRGACAMPDGATRFVSSALRVFAADFEDHARHGSCDACLELPKLPVPAIEALSAA
jgi:NADH:ubiquinone oxidoreductase subunit F (NADH-binding)